jgi:2'-5' RNA ligase
VNAKFLDHQNTQPIELRDFPEWHQGIEHFGFWAIEISHPDCLNKIQSHQRHLSKKIHPLYLRQPHITLVAAGLMADNFYNQDLLKQHIKQLENINLQAFPLQLAHCNSFTTCPYLYIGDPQDKLNSLRNCFNDVAESDHPEDYIPHVTLGFYNQAYRTSDIIKEISSINSIELEFMVSDIIFAQYKTSEIQGPYQVLHRIKLASIKQQTGRS